MTGLFRLTILVSAVAHVLYYVECRVRIINLNSNGLSEAPGRSSRFFLLQNLPDRLWALSGSYSIGTLVLFRK